MSAQPHTESPEWAADNSPGQSANHRARRPGLTAPKDQPPIAKPRDSANLICGLPTPLCPPTTPFLCIGRETGNEGVLGSQNALLLGNSMLLVAWTWNEAGTACGAIFDPLL